MNYKNTALMPMMFEQTQRTTGRVPEELRALVGARALSGSAENYRASYLASKR